MKVKPVFSRRSLSRLQDLQDIWVCCHCNGHDDISRVLDISFGGLFIAASYPKVAVGMPAKLDFLVEEGRIRADAVVRHVRQGAGLGLKFTAVPDTDSLRLKTLITRLRTS
jgi:PilZ domain